MLYGSWACRSALTRACYESLELDVKASPGEIERTYRRGNAELRASSVADTGEEPAEVEAASSVLGFLMRGRYHKDRKNDEATFIRR